MKKQTPVIYIIVRVVFILIIVSAVALVSAAASRVFGTMNRGLFIGLFVALVVSIVAYFVLKASKPYRKAKQAEAERAQAERELLRAVDEMQAIASGEVYCTEQQAKSIYNLLDYNRSDRSKKCPVCESGLEYDDNLVYTAYVTVNEKVEGVFIQRYADSNQVEQAYQTVQKNVDFPAISCRCPSCEWKLFFAEYTNYGYSAGDDVAYDHKYNAKEFFRGKLFEKNAPHNKDGFGTFHTK